MADFGEFAIQVVPSLRSAKEGSNRFFTGRDGGCAIGNQSDACRGGDGGGDRISIEYFIADSDVELAVSRNLLQ